MPELRIRNRRRLRRKDVGRLAETLAAEWGMEAPPFDDSAALDVAEADGRTVYLLDHDVVMLEDQGELAPGVRGLLRWTATRRWVTVDMGAVAFVTNGADTMAPGITEAHPEVAEGDLVWIREERHGKPLAIGRALMDAAHLGQETKGKAVAAIHHLGDKLWDVGQEEPKSNP